MDTAIKERRRGQSRGDIERLMEHRGISMGEAEELLRTHPGEALLPQQGTGLLLGTAAGIAQLGASPDARFIKDACYFPTSLRVDEPFSPRWEIVNQGDAGTVWLVMRYKGEGYLVWAGEVGAGAGGTLSPSEPIVITDLLGDIDHTQTVTLLFQLGYPTNEMTYHMTDEWEVAVYIEVPGGITWWPWLIGGGVAVVGVGIVLTGRK